MKRYSISYPREVNTKASKSGIAFHYGSRTDNPNEVIEKYKNSATAWGIKITDSQTKEVIFEDLRTVKGQLVITYKNGQKLTIDCYDLPAMRSFEHELMYKEDIEKVERIILPKD